MPDKLEPIADQNKNRLRVYIALSLVWMVVIFAFSHQAYSGRITEAYLGEAANVPVRKLGHVTEFGVLSLLYWKTLFYFLKVKGREMRPVLTIVCAFGAAFAYACLDEWHQAFVPGRSSSFYDVLVDSSGMIVAMILAYFYTRRSISIDREQARRQQSQA